MALEHTKLSFSVALGVIAVAVASLSACAFAPAAAISAAGGAAPVVYEFDKANEADSFWLARYDDVVQAVLRASKKLSLTIEEQEIGADRATLRFVDQHGAEISARIERRTETVTQMHFDFQTRQFASFAGLLGRQTIEELEKADAFVVEWSDEGDDEAE